MKLVNEINNLVEGKFSVRFNGDLEGLTITATEREIEDLWDALKDSDVTGKMSTDKNNKWIIVLEDKSSLKELKKAVKYINKNGGNVKIIGL